MPDIDEYFQETIRETVYPGFTPYADAVALLREHAEDDEDSGVNPDDAERAVRAAWDEREHYLATPPARTPTDDARVEAAFAALREAGVVAEMNCGVDQGDGAFLCKELAEEKGARGYVYFHMQDAEGLALPHAILYLGFDVVAPAGQKFGSKSEYDAGAVALGREIVTALEQQGLTVEWDGSFASRPAVVALDWRRPLPPRER